MERFALPDQPPRCAFDRIEELGHRSFGQDLSSFPAHVDQNVPQDVRRQRGNAQRDVAGAESALADLEARPAERVGRPVVERR